MIIPIIISKLPNNLCGEDACVGNLNTTTKEITCREHICKRCCYQCSNPRMYCTIPTAEEKLKFICELLKI